MFRVAEEFLTNIVSNNQLWKTGIKLHKGLTKFDMDCIVLIT